VRNRPVPPGTDREFIEATNIFSISERGSGYGPGSDRTAGPNYPHSPPDWGASDRGCGPVRNQGSRPDARQLCLWLRRPDDSGQAVRPGDDGCPISIRYHDRWCATSGRLNHLVIGCPAGNDATPATWIRNDLPGPPRIASGGDDGGKGRILAGRLRAGTARDHHDSQCGHEARSAHPFYPRGRHLIS
jgi:hypothetical protein